MSRPKLPKSCCLCGREGLVTGKGYCHSCAAALRDEANRRYINFPESKIVGVHVFADSSSEDMDKVYLFTYAPTMSFKKALDETIKEIERKNEKITRLEIYEEK